MGWHDLPSILLAIVLAFVFGYGLTIQPLVRGGLGLRAALGLAFAGDTVSITVMEVTDSAVVIAVPGAMSAGLTDPLFWGSLVLSLAIAFVIALPGKSVADRPWAGPRRRPRSPFRLNLPGPARVRATIDP